MDDPDPDDLHIIRLLLEAALKHRMREATKLAVRGLVHFAEKDPLGVCTVTTRYGMKQEVEQAARCLLGHSDVT